MAKAPKKRPSFDDEELKNSIIDRLALGETLTAICKDEGMPHVGSVIRWEMEHPEFREASLRARIHGTNRMADECIEISDDPSIDPANKRIMIDTRLRLIGKWNPRGYGDKVVNEVTGPDGQPLNSAPQVVIFQLPDNGRS